MLIETYFAIIHHWLPLQLDWSDVDAQQRTGCGVTEAAAMLCYRVCFVLVVAVATLQVDGTVSSAHWLCQSAALVELWLYGL